MLKIHRKSEQSAATRGVIFFVRKMKYMYTRNQ